MNDAALARARKAVAIQDVYLRETSVKLAPDFDARLHPTPAVVNFRWGAETGEVMEIVPPGDDPVPVNLWRIRYRTQCRVLSPRDEPRPEDYEPAADEVLCTIDAVFIADYFLTQEVDDEALHEFATTNVGYHVWPYWRELLHDVCARLRMAPVTLPMHTVRSIPQ